MARKWIDNIYGDLFFVTGGLVFTISSRDSWWAVVPAIFTVAWVILAYQRLREARKGNEPEKGRGSADT